MFLPPFFRRRAFTLIELLTVMAIIAILAALTLQVSGFVQRKAAMSRADGEIHAMEAACEAYKSDNAIYPRGPSAALTFGTVNIPVNATDSLNAAKTGTPTSYTAAGLFLYSQLSGDTNGDGVGGDSGAKIYMEFKPTQLTWSGSNHTGTVTMLSDPWGNSYGYSTANQANSANGYNATFDLWSTAGKVTAPSPGAANDVTVQWIKNW